MPAAPTVPSFTTNEGLTSADLQALATALNWWMTNKPVFRGRQTVIQSIPNNTYTSLTFDAEDKDNQNGHSTVSNTSRYVAPYDGWYLVSACYGTAANATGIRGVQLAVNGTAVNASQTVDAAVTVAMNVPAAASLVFLNTGDYVEAQAFQNSGGALNTAVSGGAYESHLDVAWICTV